jgi:intracellular multiplication protein IcmG
MSNNRGKPEDELTEFHFSDTEESNTFTSSSNAVQSGRGVAGINKRKLILLAVGSIVIVLVIFKILGGLFSQPSSKPAAQESKIAQKQPVIQPAFAPLELVNDQYIEQLEHIQEKMTQLESNLSDVHRQLAAANQTIQTLSQQLQQQVAAQAGKPVVPEKKSKVSAPKATPVVELPAYYIQAMVPGRAWLVNQKGTATTVGIGDELPGYGIINAIDVNQGLVITTQGKLISYHQDDR